jgi:apolipoprotein N-acyltransferase
MAGTGWGIVELSYGTVWPGIPYIVLGSTLIETPLVALGRLIGVHGVSALVVWCAAAVYQSVRCGSVPLATWAGGLVLLSVMLAFPRVAPLDTTTRDLHVAAVQAAVAMRSPLDSSIAQRNFDALVALSRQLPLVALIIWPENSLMATLEGRPDLATRASDLASELRTPLWAGVHRRVGAAQANSVALFSPGSKPVVIYDKVRLLPLAEAVPAWLPAPARRALGRFVSADPFVRGAISRRTLPAAAISICFESAFSGEQQDPHAEMLVNVVNDGWYDRSHAPEHLLLLARWRAIESAAPMVRAAATGISAFIDAEGRIRDSLGLGRAGTIVGVVATSSAVTPFERAGYWPLALAAAVSWVGGLIGSQEGARRVFRR